MPLTTEQQKMVDLWDQHTHSEFDLKDVDATMATMSAEPYVYNAPVMQGGSGFANVRHFYANKFIQYIPADTETVLISRTVDNQQIVDELVFKFTHDIEMAWMLPGVKPTGKRVEVPLIVIIKFEDGKVSHEHIHWDQASVLVQVGLLDSKLVPACGIESANKLSELALANR